MRSYPFAQVDVFAGSHCRGNPLAVVGDAEGLSEEQMQSFARWTNLSETTFLLHPTSPDADYRVRIYTGSQELPFAGHPTLGTAHAWLQAHPGHQRERIVQECGLGRVELRRTESGLAFAAPPLLRTEPVAADRVVRIAEQLAIGPDRIESVRLIDNGPGWIGVLLAEGSSVYEVATPGPDAPIGVISRHADGPYAIEVRAFFPGGQQVFEDPVTGSLNAAVGQWLLGAGLLSAPYRAHQGTAVGADGVITIDQDPDGTIWVGGATTTMISGTVQI
jgi:predicted PhzF superfamily epimerase YddE/YHI9